MSVTSGVYYIRNVKSGTVIDLKGGSPTPGTDTQGWPKRSLSDPWVPAQLWVVYKGAGNIYTVENTNSRTFLDLQNAANGTPVEGLNPSASPNQKWVITQVPGHSYYTIRNVATGRYVDLDSGNSAPGTKVQGWVGIANNPNQQWYFDKA